MANKTYSEKLKDPRWQKRRLEVLNRDNFSCYWCGDKESTLHVHHEMYLGKDPWDTPEECLTSLCDDCHFTGHLPITQLEKELLEIIRATNKGDTWYLNSINKLVQKKIEERKSVS